MNFMILILNSLSCICVLHILYRFRKMKEQIYSRAWAIINIAFVTLLVKWLYDGWLLYGVVNNDIYTLIHELLTFIFALMAAIGFNKFSRDFFLGTTWVKRYLRKQSGEFAKTLISDLEEGAIK